MKKRKASFAHDLDKKEDSELVEVIRNRERAELLLIDEVKQAKSEILLASSSIGYLKHLANLGLLDTLEQAKSRSAQILILCPEINAATKNESEQKVIRDFNRYAQIRNVAGQIKGTILIVDNSKVLSISEEGIDALTIYSDNRSLVNNFGSLFEALWIEKEMLHDLVKSKNELLRSNEQLKIHDKMQQEFINIAAHELRTPVQPILAIAEMLGYNSKKAEEEEEEEEEVRGIKIKDIKMMARNARRLERLSSSILDTARIGSGNLKLEKKTFDISQLAIDAIEDCKRFSAGSGINFELTKASGDMIVNADRERVMQVLSNLLNNSAKFTGSGGKISLIIDTCHDRQQDQVRIRVKDTGSGIDPEIMPRLFTQFGTSPTMPSGTGLGLFISKGIIEAHGGRIWAENNPEGKGATFSFELPIGPKTDVMKLIQDRINEDDISPQLSIPVEEDNQRD